MEKIIQLEHVIKMHSGEIRAVNELDLTVVKGQFVVISGERSSGKTTLLNLINGMSHPSEGRITVMGHDYGTMPDSEVATLRNTSIGTVTRQPQFISNLSLVEQVMLPLRIQGMDVRSSKRKAMEVLEQLKLVSCRYYRPAQMSPIEKCLGSIAMEIVKQPDILLIDDICTAYDQKQNKMLVDIINQIYCSNSITIVYFTSKHIDGLKNNACFHMEHGRIEIKEEML